MAGDSIETGRFFVAWGCWLVGWLQANANNTKVIIQRNFILQNY
jgi:hypothetical protein